jgi:L-ribulokinase
MANKKYSIGIDYGTESGRALLVDIQNGEELAVHVTPYPHGVIDDFLPNSGLRLELDWALQHPGDYMHVLFNSVPEVLRISGVDPADVIGLGIDFTSCTILPLDESGIPLCYHADYQNEPHSWVKLWKHHAAQEEADLINELAGKMGQTFLPRYGGKISSEWMHPKIWQVLREAPHLYEAADLFLEAGDWVVQQLTGNVVRNSCAAGYKALWHKTEGYPDKSFLRELDSRLETLTETKLRGAIAPLGTKAGGLIKEMAQKMGLLPGTAVAVAIIDAHAAVPGAGVAEVGKLVMSMGTSTCHLLLATEEKHVEGVCGVVEDGIIPGLFAYEAGQAAVGDMFAWYVENGVPAYVQREAENEGLNVHNWLEQRAEKYLPGETGLLALDWWNGNRSVLVDANLSGMIIGFTLMTKPEEIYRTLLESTAFGTRRIIDAFEANGVEVRELYACGGLPQKNRLLMQIYADITNREIKIAASNQTPALGSAMFGAVAAGSAMGGYDQIQDAASQMARFQEQTFKPDPANVLIYDVIYGYYCRLHDELGRGSNDVMKQLKALGKKAKA